MCASCCADRVFGVLLHWQAERWKNVQRVVVDSGQPGSISIKAHHAQKLYLDYVGVSVQHFSVGNRIYKLLLEKGVLSVTLTNTRQSLSGRFCIVALP
jgi:hypothetical protein